MSIQQIRMELLSNPGLYGGLNDAGAAAEMSNPKYPVEAPVSPNQMAVWGQENARFGNIWRLATLQEAPATAAWAGTKSDFRAASAEDQAAALSARSAFERDGAGYRQSKNGPAFSALLSTTPPALVQADIDALNALGTGTESRGTQIGHGAIVLEGEVTRARR